MTVIVFYKLLAIIATVALGYLAGRMRWLESGAVGSDPPRVLGNAAYFFFIPALLFRTTVRLDLPSLPWHTVGAFFVPVMGMLLAVYVWQRSSGQAARHGAAAPSVRAISASFGNSVQVGIPLAAALFGEAGLAIHIALVSLHAILLLTVLTVLAELDLARARAQHESAPTLLASVRLTVRNTIVHPVVLPVLAGLLWNLAGWGLHPAVDEALAVLASAVVPLCLTLIGLNLAYVGLKDRLRGAVVISIFKLLILPAVVLAVAHWGFGLTGVPLSVVVVMAALPVGSNALIFSQRYDTLEAEATAAIVLSTLAFTLTATFWLGVLAWIA